MDDLYMLEICRKVVGKNTSPTDTGRSECLCSVSSRPSDRRSAKRPSTDHVHTDQSHQLIKDRGRDDKSAIRADGSMALVRPQ